MSVDRTIILREESGSCGGSYEVAAGQSLELYQLCSEGTHKVCVTLAAGAHAKIVFAAVSEAELEYDYNILLEGPEAEVELYGVMMARESGSVRVRTALRHNAPHCRSNQQVRGVASERGYGLYDGLVYVAPDAQKTEAYQQSRNLLLSPEARIQTQPQLEIYADDVKCSHGATVGQMNEEQIYYMRQRGLSEEDARRLSLSGFVGEIVGHIDDEALRAEFEEKVRT